MFKIGDKVQSFNEVDVPSKPFGRCRYCNNLSRPTEAQGSIFRGQEVSLKNLCNESWNRDCPWCAILARCIKLLEPETSKMVEAEPDRPMWCFINRHNSISIRWHWTNMQVTERCSFQLYRSPSTGTYWLMRPHFARDSMALQSLKLFKHEETREIIIYLK
jgi:hypothetical protein